MNIIGGKDLKKKFHEFSAIDSISFNVKKGEIFTFLRVSKITDLKNYY